MHSCMPDEHVMPIPDNRTCMSALMYMFGTCRYLAELTIPAAFVTKTTGDILKGVVENGKEEAYVILDWTDVLPRANKVQWQFWSG